MNSPFKSLARLVLLVCLLAFARPAPGLTFNIIYDSSVTALTNAAQVETAFAYATQAFTNSFTNPITIYLTLYWGNTGPFSSEGTYLSSSSANLAGTNIGNNFLQFTYPQVTNALRLVRNDLDDSNAVASLPAADPMAANLWWIPIAEARALRTYPGTGTNVDDGNDGAVGFGTGFTFTYSPTNRAVPGAYDFIGLAQHEITEVMGRTCGLNLFGNFVPYDLFRFTNNGGRSTNIGNQGVYFSVNKGATVIKYFWTNYNTGDIQDWLPANAPNNAPDSDDAKSPSGKLLELTPADFTALDILGYNGPMPTNPFSAGIRRTNNTFQLSFTNNPGATFSVLYTTNLTLAPTNWTFLGNPTQSTAGHYLYIDTPAATTNVRIYRIRSP